MRPGAAGMDDSLRNPLVVKVRDLFSKMEVFQQRRPAVSGLQRILIIIKPQALVRREKLLRSVIGTES